MTKKKKKNEEIDSDDQFLRLPEPILHCILSYLSCKDLGRTSILSKRWKNLWITASTTLQFNDDFFGMVDPSWKLMNVVERTLRSRHDHKLSLEALVLHVPHCTSNMEACLDRCISYAIGCNVKRLNLRDASCQGHWYTLPRAVLTSKTLTDLSLVWCRLESLTSCLSLPSLKALRFLSVSADGQTIQNLINSCPLIEVLQIHFCFISKGRSNLNISSLNKLVTADIGYCEFGRVRIDAPSLESLEFHGTRKYDAPCDIMVSVPTCKNIKKLMLYDAPITDKWFHSQLSNLFLFEKLEDLVLHKCVMLESIKISSCRLKHLSISRCRNLVKVKIDGPILSTFTYTGAPDLIEM